MVTGRCSERSGFNCKLLDINEMSWPSVSNICWVGGWSGLSRDASSAGLRPHPKPLHERGAAHANVDVSKRQKWDEVMMIDCYFLLYMRHAIGRPIMIVDSTIDKPGAGNAHASENEQASE